MHQILATIYKSFSKYSKSNIWFTQFQSQNGVQAINGIMEHLLLKAQEWECDKDSEERWKSIVNEIHELASLTKNAIAMKTVCMVYTTCPL